MSSGKLASVSQKDGDLLEAKRALEVAATEQTDIQIGTEYHAVVKIARAYAYTWLGYMHATGKCGSVNLKKAFDFYQKAADMGVGEAQTNLGNMYYHGVQDVVAIWFGRASANDVSLTGEACLDGRVNWLRRRPQMYLHRKPSYQLHAMKQFARTVLNEVKYDSSNESFKGPMQGFQHLFMAAMGGCAETQLWIGSLFLVGLRQFCDRRKALFWLHKSHVQGNSTARKVSET